MQLNQAIRAFASAARSERAIAFLLDLANQHGDAGAESICRKSLRPGISESDLMARMETESLARVHKQFGDGAVVESTRARRQAFRENALLSEGPFAA